MRNEMSDDYYLGILETYINVNNLHKQDINLFSGLKRYFQVIKSKINDFDYVLDCLCEELDYTGLTREKIENLFI